MMNSPAHKHPQYAQNIYAPRGRTAHNNDVARGRSTRGEKEVRTPAHERAAGWKPPAAAAGAPAPGGVEGRLAGATAELTSAKLNRLKASGRLLASARTMSAQDHAAEAGQASQEAMFALQQAAQTVSALRGTDPAALRNLVRLSVQFPTGGQAPLSVPALSKAAKFDALALGDHLLKVMRQSASLAAATGALEDLLHPKAQVVVRQM